MKKLILSVVFALALLTTPLLGNDFYGQDSFEVPMGLNVGITGNYGGCTGDCADAIDPGFGFGLSIGYRVSMSLSVYAEFLDNFVNPKNDNSNLDYSYLQGNLGVNFYLMPTSKFQPFVTAGLGNFRMTAESDDGDYSESEDFQTLFIGGGAEFIISDNMTIPFKLQYSKIVHSNNDLEKDATWNILVGLNYYF